MRLRFVCIFASKWKVKKVDYLYWQYRSEFVEYEPDGDNVRNRWLQ